MRILGLMMAAAAASGCSTGFGRIGYTKNLTPDNATSTEVLMVDANQRAILSREQGVCAEPSPDAVTAASLAASARGAVPGQGSGEAALAMSQSAASIGIRTPSIQLLRDGMYRLCEAYQNGAIKGDEYHAMLLQYQQMVVGLVAIEQLTGVVRAPQVTLSGGRAEAETLQATMSTQTTLVETWVSRREQVRQRITSIANFERETDDNGQPLRLHRDHSIYQSLVAEEKSLSDRIESMNRTIETTSSQVAVALASARAGPNAGGGGNGGGNGVGQIDPVQLDDDMYSAETAAAIAKVVKDITFRIINSGDSRAGFAVKTNG